jgi:hypothetical protein
MSRNGLSEPQLTAIEKEKMVYVNERHIPFTEDSLTAREIMERTGYAPEKHTLYVSPSSETTSSREYSGIGKPVNEQQKLQIKNGMKIHIVLKPQ